MVRLLLLVVLVLTPSLAAAGMRATFVGPLGYRQVIRVADNGDLEIEMPTGGRLIVNHGRAFFVDDRLTGPIVTPLEDLTAAVAERAAATRPPPSPEIQAALDAVEADLDAAARRLDDPATGAPPDRESAVPPGNRPPEGPASRARTGATVVNGRAGRSYHVPRFDGGEQLFAVMSDDPALAPIGEAFRRGLDAREKVRRLEWESSSPPPGLDAEERAILASGTPLQYYEATLRDVEQVALPAIPLPAAPESAAALRARLAAEAAARDAPSPPEWNASRVVFAAGRLYLVAGDNRLLSVAEGETSLTRHDPGAPVLDACAQGASLLVLTGATEGARAWTLRRLRGGQWQAERTLARDGDEAVGLACAAEGVFILTSNRFVDLSPARPSVLRLRGDPVRPLVTAAIHVTPRAVFVGLNAGEWGGGLRRIDRRSGRIEVVARNATGELCDGPLNTDCDPVQGIATLPWRPDCVAVAIGMIHMMAHGRLTRVCPDRVDQLYAATDGPLDTPDSEREAALGRYGSIAFFGLARTGDSLLAVGHNGLHRVGRDGATHVPLPRFVRVEGLLVSFALPEAVLVVTGINGRASLSGAVPIMAVRQ
ncbi:MAG TPA: hypothetical protein VMG08_12675 [Allosphingosinicella sp.]|nr:hypothetical protein [Allosphingosinicella sp.]